VLALCLGQSEQLLHRAVAVRARIGGRRSLTTPHAKLGLDQRAATLGHASNVSLSVVGDRRQPAAHLARRSRFDVLACAGAGRGGEQVLVDAQQRDHAMQGSAQPSEVGRNARFEFVVGDVTGPVP